MRQTSPIKLETLAAQQKSMNKLSGYINELLAHFHPYNDDDISFAFVHF